MHVLSPVDKDGAVQMAIIASIRSYLLHFGSAADADILLVESVLSPRLYFPAVPLIHYARRPFHLATLRSAGGSPSIPSSSPLLGGDEDDVLRLVRCSACLFPFGSRELRESARGKADEDIPRPQIELGNACEGSGLGSGGAVSSRGRSPAARFRAVLMMVVFLLGSFAGS